ncbi:MAG TPA: glycerol-3-phosphate dehydrogenase, partial [Undibacterium sp.]|nr:glycerol-3-phosphate dehydrogenase [Undibacterium sp.]
LGHVAEGVRCAQAVKTLAAKLNVEMPIADAVAGVLFDDVPVQQMIGRLLARDAKQELS